MIAPRVTLEKENFGQTMAILGKRGSGKSHTARVMIEEGRALGVCFLVIDPQHAYDNLPGFDYIMAKNVKDAKNLGVLIAATAKNTVIRTSGLTITEQAVFVKKLLEGYRITVRKGIRCVVIDECHKFAPEGSKAESREEVRAMSQENRSDGLGFIAVEQRSQRIDKTILSQADYMIIHRMTSKRDTMAVENYLDNPESDIPKIKKLQTGEAFFYGFSDDAFTSKVRESTTEHSGGSPKHLLTENIQAYNQHINKIVRGRSSMEATNKSDAANLMGVRVPSLQGFMDLAANGAKMSLGLGVASVVGVYASRLNSPVPMVSSRTLASAAVTIATYSAYKATPQSWSKTKDVFGYAAAGAAIHTAGSALFDVLNAAGVNLPPVVNYALTTMTGARPFTLEGSARAQTPGGENVDLNTAMA